MKKTDKKLDHQIRARLTDVCEQALETVDGFEWLTHTVNYANVSSSLNIICVFTTEEQCHHASNSLAGQQLVLNIIDELTTLNIQLKKPNQQIQFDSEQACENQSNGNWAKHLQ
ncbi:Fis family transcriptional regulator [Echinimonas agarilytica]|uniref:Fis family transcriptional regulator n=1 Tax=Echinimonas agarilytica TaxID=1215918 RepID=A0AA41W8W8_9GAMM|nr:Fis family transcriptional regulator [Echinimonas agarilytica]MCM2680279.1 Fis family transcriptional regulator [Echinimonas agarilytica]